MSKGNKSKRNLPSVHIQESPTHRLPITVAAYPESIEPEDRPFLISFRYYNYRECEVSKMLKNAPKECIENLKTIGRATPQTLNSMGINTIPVHGENEYKQILNGTGLEWQHVAIREHKIQGTHRLFYFTEDNIFHVVLIKATHYDTEKQR